jgi:hypothetical protein
MSTEATKSTYDAVLWVLRQDGKRRLNDVWLTSRLAGFSDQQINELLAALRRMQPRYSAITDDLIAALQLLRA